MVLEDIMHLDDKTKYDLPSSEDDVIEKCPSDLEYSFTNAHSANEQSGSVAAKCSVTNEVPELFVPSDTIECVIEEGSTIINQSSTEHPVANINNTSKSRKRAISPETVLLENCDDFAVGTSYQFQHGSADNSELVDDPSMQQALVNGNDLISSDRNHYSNAGVEPEVEFLFVKKPTHEVITLEVSF